MICPHCHVPMEIEEMETEQVHLVIDEFPFEDDEVVIVTYWRCVICDYVDETYDA